MVVTCGKCGIDYDDAVRLTICPHDRFITDFSARQKDLAWSMRDKRLRFNHDPEGKIGTYTIESISGDGLVTMRSEGVNSKPFVGEFSPTCFMPVKEELKMDGLLFEVNMLNEQGKHKALEIAASFNELLNKLNNLCPDPSREMSLVKTKLEEACFYAKKAMANRPENQA